MLLLTSTVDLLRIVTSAAVTVDVHASWVDNAAGTITPGRTNTAITTATTTTVVASPGASTQRNVQTLVVRNKHAVTAVTITVLHTDGTTTVELFKAPVLAGQELSYVDGVGFRLLDATGNVLTAAQTRRVVGVYDAEADFGFRGDLVTVFDGACSTGANTKITSATAAFTTNAVVGQRITLAGAGASGAQYTGTITAIDSATQVDVSPAISTTVSAKGLSFGTDNTAAITAMTSAINNATFPGAVVMFGHSATNAYGFPTRVQFTKPVQIVGIGGGHNTDTGDYTRTGGTRLAWWGTSIDSGTAYGGFFEVAPTGVQSLKRVAFRHCWLDCRNGDQNEALYGLKLMSCHGFMLEDFFIMDAMAIGLWTNIDSDPTEAKDTTRFSIRDICIRMLDNPQAGAMTTPVTSTSAVTLSTTPQSLTVGANTLPTAGYAWIMCSMGFPVLLNYTGGGGTTTLTGCTVSAEDNVYVPVTVSGVNVVQAVPSNGAGMVFGGGSTANTCCGLIEMIQIVHGTTWGPAAIEFHNSDSIDHIQIMINGGNATNDGAINRIRKPGVRLNGNNTNAVLAARNNTFRGGSAGAGGVSVMGVLNTGSRLLAMSEPHYWDLYQLGNGEALPTVEGNAYYDWQPNGGIRTGPRGSVTVADQAVTAATLTLINGSLIRIPPQGWQIGSVFWWRFYLDKTGAGTAATAFHIRAGTLGTTGDGLVATFTTGVGTAVADSGVVEVSFTVRSLGASAAGIAHLTMDHNLAATGWLVIPTAAINGTMATWNSTTATFLSMSITSGASVAPTIRSCYGECINPSNP